MLFHIMEHQSQIILSKMSPNHFGKSLKSIVKFHFIFEKKILGLPIFRGGPVPLKSSNFEFSFLPFLILTLEVTYVRIWANSERKKSYFDMFFADKNPWGSNSTCILIMLWSTGLMLLSEILKCPELEHIHLGYFPKFFLK